MKTPHRGILAALCLMSAPLAHAGQADNRLDIYWCDVEGGGATLIVTPAGESILIDSGNPGPRDAGRIHHVAADIAGLKKIDFYITTHFHVDHFGGAAQLAALMPIGQVYDRGIPEHDPDHRPNADGLWLQSIRPYREFAADGRHLVIAGLVLPLRQEGAVPLALRCVASGGDLIRPAAGAARQPARRGEFPPRPSLDGQRPEQRLDPRVRALPPLGRGRPDMEHGGEDGDPGEPRRPGGRLPGRPPWP